MSRTFGTGPRLQKGVFWAFGIGPSAENVGKSQGKCKKTMRREKRAVFGRCGSPWMTTSCENKRPCFEKFANISCVFFDFPTLFSSFKPFFPYLPISSIFYFKYSTTHNIARNTYNTQAHSIQYPQHPQHTARHTTPNHTTPHHNIFCTCLVLILVVIPSVSGQAVVVGGGLAGMSLKGGAKKPRTRQVVV